MLQKRNRGEQTKKRVPRNFASVHEGQLDTPMIQLHQIWMASLVQRWRNINLLKMVFLWYPERAERMASPKPLCVVCDCCIIGVEKVHALNKDCILLNAKRLSVETYEEFYGETLHPIIKKQYQVDEIKGLLCSPRSYHNGDTFECCSACISSLKPSQKKTTISHQSMQLPMDL